MGDQNRYFSLMNLGICKLTIHGALERSISYRNPRVTVSLLVRKSRDILIVQEIH